MSNYRVQQVLALDDKMPGRQLRLLVALATFMDDYSLHVVVGFAALITVTGNTRKTVRLARRELEKGGQLKSTPGHGRGHLTAWDVLCLPGEGFSVIASPVKGVTQTDPLSEDIKGVTPDDKRGYPQTADLQERDRCLNSLSKEPRSAAAKAPRSQRGKTCDRYRNTKHSEACRQGKGTDCHMSWCECACHRRAA